MFVRAFLKRVIIDKVRSVCSNQRMVPYHGIMYYEDDFMNGRYTMSHWTFLTNHAQVLLFIAHHHQVTARDIAANVGITERSVLHIVRELEDTGYIRRFHEGRTNRYEVDLSQPLRHPAQRGQPIRALVTLLEQYLDDTPTSHP